VRILINYDHHSPVYSVHVLAEDAKTLISGWTNVASERALLKLLAYYGCVDMECEKASLRYWGRGSAWCEPSPGLKDLLVYCFLNNWTNCLRNNKRALSRISRLRALEISALTHSLVMLCRDRISSSLS
jgi:hypothetical protein